MSNQLPPLPRNADTYTMAERLNVLIQEYNRADIRRVLYADDTGTATAFAITPVPGISLYEVGQLFVFTASHANSGAGPTLNVNGKGAGTITWPDGTALAAGDIPNGAIVVVGVASTTPTFHLLAR